MKEYKKELENLKLLTPEAENTINILYRDMVDKNVMK